MDSTSIAMLVALVALVAMSGYFSATETAFTSLNRIRLKNKADNGDRRAARTLELAEDYDRLLSSILIGNNIVNNVATTIGAVLFIRLLDDVRGPTVSAIVLTVVILIFGEVSPKSLAKESPEAWAMLSAPLLRAFVAVLTPANFLFTQWKRLLSLIIHKREEDGITEEELVTMVDQAENEGGLDEHESELIRNAIEFHDLEVSEILTPRVDIVAAEENSTMEEVGSLFAESGYSRLPIYQDSIDNIVGVIHEKDFYAARYRGETMISALKAPVLYTTGNTKISELMRILQRNKAHMAVVVDEYGHGGHCHPGGHRGGAGGRHLGRTRRGHRGVQKAGRRQLSHRLLRRPGRYVRPVRRQGCLRRHHRLRLGDGAGGPGPRGGGPLPGRGPGCHRYPGGAPPGHRDPGAGTARGGARG